MVNASKAEFTYHVLQNVVVCYSVITTAKCLAQRTAHHVLKGAKTNAHTANANTNVGTHAKNAKKCASGGVGICSAQGYAARCAIGLAVTNRAEKD